MCIPRVNWGLEAVRNKWENEGLLLGARNTDAHQNIL